MSKRELISPNGDKRLIRRDEQGRIRESDDLGKSLAQDVLSLAWRDCGPATLSLLGARQPSPAPDEAAGSAQGTSQSGALEQAELALLRQAIRRSGGNLAAAARDLGVSRATVAYRAKKFGLAV